MDPKEAKIKRVEENLVNAASNVERIKASSAFLNKLVEIMEHKDLPIQKRFAAAVLGMGEVRNFAEELISHGSSLRRLCDLIEPELEELP